MLVLVWWHPDEPGTLDIRREPHLFASEQDCQAEGANRVAGVEMYHLEHNGVKVSFACMPVPAHAEYDRLFAELDEERRDQPGVPQEDEGADGAAGDSQ